MMRRPIAAAAAMLLLTGCEVQVANEQAAQTNAAEPADGNAATEAVATVPVERETALRLMEARHENYEKIGDAMKVITRQLRSDSPNLTEVRLGAQTIATLAPQVPTWFPAGTGPDVGRTEARAEIWQRPEDFGAKAAAFAQAARRFETAAQGTDFQAIRAAHAELGKACKACHDLYREEH